MLLEPLVDANLGVTLRRQSQDNIDLYCNTVLRQMRTATVTDTSL